MPAEPRDFRVLTDLREALRGIRVDAGYYSDVHALAVKLDPDQALEEFIRADEDGAPPAVRPLVIVELLPDGFEYFPAEQLRHVINVRVNWVAESDPTDDESRLRTYLRACADVEMAINLDTTRAGDVVDTRIVRRAYDTAVGGAEVWAMLDVQMITHRRAGAPAS